MRDVVILPVKPKILTAKAKKQLSDAGVIVIECLHPEKIRLVRPSQELTGGDIAISAMRALVSGSGYGESKAFCNEILKAMELRHGTNIRQESSRADVPTKDPLPNSSEGGRGYDGDGCQREISQGQCETDALPSVRAVALGTQGQ